MFKQLRRRLLCVVIWLVAGSAFAQNIPDKEAYFGPLNAALAQAKEQRVQLLAPKLFADANEALQDLQKYYSGKPNPEQLQKQRDQVQQAIDKAQQMAVQASKTLNSVVKAYDDAVVAGAAQTQGEAWKKAEQRLMQAVAKVEGNDLDAARSKGAEAEVLLREVELQAIKFSVLAEARNLISQAQTAKVADYAPRSLALAQQQLALADQQLARNRYEMQEPKRLVAQATYEIKHAQYLSALIQRAQSKEGVKQQLAEEQWLALEAAVRELAAEFNKPDLFDSGIEPVIRAVQSSVLDQQQQMADLRSTLVDRDQQIIQLKAMIDDLNAAISKLENKLGSESQERQELQKRLAAQERVRENIATIEALFTSEEGRVYRQANHLIMSLNAINFRSGKSIIESSSLTVLEKVKQAIQLFPKSSISVEGHTDSAGSDSANLLLSQDRADAVRDYLVSTLGVNVEKISSIGYGESRPVANNETESGRVRNRRIEIVIDTDAVN